MYKCVPIKNLLLNLNAQLNRQLSFFSCENINNDVSIYKKERSNLPCMYRQQVKQLGHQTRSTTIYQKKMRVKENSKANL